MDAVAFFDALLGLSAKQAHDLSIAQTCVRALIVYGVLVAYIRFGKKRFLSEATAFDAVLVIVIGSLSSRAVSGTAPFFASLAATWVFIAIHWVISYFSQSVPWLGRLVKGHNSVLVKDGRVDPDALAQAHMSSEDLAQDLRERGVEQPNEVKEARLERSGNVSVIKKKL
jgi:uncharacterized membrane protein YcaP (DUF421 family)